MFEEAAVEERVVGREVAPLRVLHLHSGNMYGGVESLLVTLARMRKVCPGIEPHFGLCFEERVCAELNAVGAPVHLLGGVRLSRPWTVWRARRRLRDLLRTQAFDAVICHMTWPLVVFGATARKAGLKVVYYAHTFYHGTERLERLGRRFRPDLMISVSHSVGESMSRLYPDVPARVLYNSVVLTRTAEGTAWRSAVRRELGADDQTAVIIQVSRFEDWKGHLLHLRALAKIRTAQPWVCWMVGGAQMEAERRHLAAVRQAVQDWGLTDRVRFLGQRSDVARLLAGADIYCQPNQGPEPFGIAFVEALWAGLPVISTAMGGAAEIVDASCGVLVEPENAGQLAEVLDRLIEAPRERARLGSGGAARARLLCDPAARLDDLHKMLSGVLCR